VTVTPGAELTAAEFERFCGLIYKVSGIRIPPTKRVMVSNRLRRRLRATGLTTFAAYYALLTSSSAGAAEMPLFLDEITTNETYFFRDTQHFDWFGNDFLPALVRDAHARKRPRSLRVWSAAASTGEELYSLAMKVHERKDSLAGWKTTLLGTDLSAAVLAAARAGAYDERSLRNINPAQRQLYFDRDPSGVRWVVKPELRAMATWKVHNLLSAFGEPPFDLVLLKNVMIYFDPASKQTVVNNLRAAMADGGYLIVGPTEGVHNLLGGLVRHSTWLYQKAPA
jgi:chemotaxis protein methyltransferase CheR